MEYFDWRFFKALLRRMRQCCDANGARFLAFMHPSLGEVWDPYIARTVREQGLGADQYDRYALENRARSVAADAGVDLCPQVRYFAERQERGPFNMLPRDLHCNPIGNQLTAEVLARHLLDRGYLAAQDHAAGR